MVSHYLQISGLVQGVGFRPYIYRHAREHHLNGWVRNYNGGVEVCIQGQKDQCEKFVETLAGHAPPVADIRTVSWRKMKYPAQMTFAILPSRNGYEGNTEIAPDLAVCDQCLDDIHRQPRRKNHLFTSCTHCGPRFSIVEKIPYDRQNTSMKNFAMCRECNEEYQQMNDRRFHAQPIACMNCGPVYYWQKRNTNDLCQDLIPKELAVALENDEIIAVKATGGYHLLCNAKNEELVGKLRKIKHRDAKPFALLFKDPDTVREYTFMSKLEENLLLSPRRPVVILKKKKDLSSGIGDGMNSYGVMLPYTPLYSILMQETHLPALVCTSANLSGQSLISDDPQAVQELLPVCDNILSYNRQIIHKQDDSVLRVIAGKGRVLRRSRGYAPESIVMKEKVDGIIALGGDMKNCFCIGKERRAIMSQHIGDLHNYEVYLHYQRSICELTELFNVKPNTFACDAHPGFFSSHYGNKLQEAFAGGKKPNIYYVQHHHAHIASVMAENGMDEKVIGIAMDGTGYGDDGKIWGSEFMVCDLSDYQRFFHMEYIRLQGGEKAIKEPWRIALSCVYDLFGERYRKLYPEMQIFAARPEHDPVIEALKRNLNTIESCGLGRLFDAVAALLNITPIARFEGEGPMKLENLISSESDKSYSYSWENNTFLIGPLIKDILEDIHCNVISAEIAVRFHNTIANIICDGAMMIAKKTGLHKVVLSGGTFQNAYLTNRVVKQLEDKGLLVLLNEKVPCNDGGLALGQLAIAMKKLP